MDANVEVEEDQEPIYSTLFDENIVLLCITYLSSLLSFGLLFFSTYRCTHRAHQACHGLEGFEIRLIRTNSRVYYALLVILIVLQIPLLMNAMANPDRSSLFESIARPMGSLCLLFIGFGTKHHPIFRWLYGLTLIFLIMVDTVSEVYLIQDIACFEKEDMVPSACSHSRASSFEVLRALQARDLVAIWFEIWILLFIGFFGITIGMCSSKYPTRLLSLSHPLINIRDVLKRHHSNAV